MYLLVQLNHPKEDFPPPLDRFVCEGVVGSELIHSVKPYHMYIIISYYAWLRLHCTILESVMSTTYYGKYVNNSEF